MTLGALPTNAPIPITEINPALLVDSGVQGLDLALTTTPTFVPSTSLQPGAGRYLVGAIMNFQCSSGDASDSLWLGEIRVGSTTTIANLLASNAQRNDTTRQKPMTCSACVFVDLGASDTINLYASRTSTSGGVCTASVINVYEFQV